MKKSKFASLVAGKRLANFMGCRSGEVLHANITSFLACDDHHAWGRVDFPIRSVSRSPNSCLPGGEVPGTDRICAAARGTGATQWQLIQEVFVEVLGKIRRMTEIDLANCEGDIRKARRRCACPRYELFLDR